MPTQNLHPAQNFGPIPTKTPNFQPKTDPDPLPTKSQNKFQAIEDAKDDLMTFDSLLFENLD